MNRLSRSVGGIFRELNSKAHTYSKRCILPFSTNTQIIDSGTTSTSRNFLQYTNNNNNYGITTNSIRAFSSSTANPSSSNQVHIKERIEGLIKKNKVVVFMKGVPEEPKCGFSNAVVQVLRMHGVQNYDAHNILEDEALRQGIKDYSNWPTIPQIYMNGEFVGGCDILLEMHKNGELIEQLDKIGIKSALVEETGKSG